MLPPPSGRTGPGGIEGKKDYFQDKLNGGGLADADKAKFEQFLKDLDEFDTQGKHYYGIQTALKQVQGSLTSPQKGGTLKEALDDAYSQARKDAALRAKSPKEADEALREVCGSVRQKASKAERKAVYDYTCGSGGFSRPLRGYEGDWYNFKGIGKVDLNNEGRAGAIKHMTGLINKSSYDIDVWLQRGVETAQGAAGLLGVPESVLKNLGGDTQSMMNLDKAIIDVEESHAESLPMAEKLFGKTACLSKSPPDSMP